MLEDAGFEAYIVGGSVRDLLLGVPPHDYDIATSALPQQTAAVFEDCKIIETGIKHGTLTVIMDSLPLEITTFRSDGDYADNRHPERVTFVTSLREDLSRRDFTICAMAMDKDGKLYDFFDGKGDLERRTVRCVGSPVKRFNEDALRMLRALRFASVLNFDIEENTAAALVSQAELIKNVSAERIAVELFKTLRGNFAPHFLKHTHLLSQIIPEIDEMNNCEQINIHHIYNVWQHSVVAAQSAPADPVMRFALLLHDVGKPKTRSMGDDGQHHFYGHADASADIARRVCRSLKLSNDNTARIVTLVKYHDYPFEQSKKILRRRLAKFGEKTTFDLLDMKCADNAAQSPSFDRSSDYDALRRLLNEILEEKPCLSLSDLAVDGNDIKSLGASGRQIGDVLNKLFARVVDGTLQNEREVLTEAAKRYL